MLKELIIVLIVSLLVVWFTLSVVFQFYTDSFSPSWLSVIVRYDVFHLLPRWTFFAPNPGTSDYHLLYRDQKEDGTISGWVEIPMVEERKPLSFIWNPEKRSKKILLDVTMSLIQTSQGLGQSKVLIISLPYLILLNVVVHYGHKTRGIRRQFVLAETFWEYTAPHVLLVSAFHPMQQRNRNHHPR